VWTSFYFQDAKGSPKILFESVNQSEPLNTKIRTHEPVLTSLLYVVLFSFLGAFTFDLYEKFDDITEFDGMP
jgi:hypothetical protein